MKIHHGSGARTARLTRTHELCLHPLAGAAGEYLEVTANKQRNDKAYQNNMPTKTLNVFLSNSFHGLHGKM
ncbi:hypothetical protein O3297_11015 [Janthinobacterium sp. SUN128]|uniref:hypothetical protein n=1 Tax=Janthinobacterium sp. SUN128 TaxID=3014790 RepID=UPI002712B4AF|nr:hypothetical protein [Janthinobacterium sp. SUN128]MDO8033949.1 hypothetical protein [Janthinobacterium sp. SUN128]